MTNTTFDPAQLQRLRQRRRLTKEGVALLAYCEDSAYEQWENGDETPSAFWQERLARALRCRVEDFMPQRRRLREGLNP